MKARILTLDSDEHRVVQSLLPWYVNATLDDRERALVDDHLAECARCQADVEFQRHLRLPPDTAAPPGDVDRGWTALRARLEPAPAGGRPVPRIRWRWTRWLPLAMGLQTGLVLALTVLLFGQTGRADYRTLGASTGATANVVIVFRPDATEADIRRALRAVDAGLVGGPTVTDAYLLYVPDPGPQALARLRSQPAVARVESLESEHRR